MGNALIAFLVAVAAAAWLYGKTMKQSGNNAKNSIIVAGLIALCVFVVVLLLLNAFIKQ